MKCLPTYNGVRFNTIDELKQYIVDRRNEEVNLRREKIIREKEEPAQPVYFIDANSENSLLAAMAMNSYHAFRNGKMQWNPIFMFRGKQYRDLEDAWSKLKDKKEQYASRNESYNFKLLKALMYTQLTTNRQYFDALNDAITEFENTNKQGLFWQKLGYKPNEVNNVMSSSYNVEPNEGNRYVLAMEEAFNEAYSYYMMKGYKQSLLDELQEVNQSSPNKKAVDIRKKVNELYELIKTPYDYTVAQIHAEALRHAKFISKYSTEFKNDEDRKQYLKDIEAELMKQKVNGTIGLNVKLVMEEQGNIRDFTDEEMDEVDMDESDFYHTDANARIESHRKRYRVFFDWMRVNGYSHPEISLIQLLQDKKRTPEGITYNETTFNQWLDGLDDKLMAEGLRMFRLKNFISLKNIYGSMSIQAVNMIRINKSNRFTTIQLNGMHKYAEIRRRFESFINNADSEKLMEHYNQYHVEHAKIRTELTAALNDRDNYTLRQINQIKKKAFYNDLKYLSLLTGIEENIWKHYFHDGNEWSVYEKFRSEQGYQVDKNINYETVDEIFDRDTWIYSKPGNSQKEQTFIIFNIIDGFLNKSITRSWDKDSVRHPFEQFKDSPENLKKAIKEYFLGSETEGYRSNIYKLSSRYGRSIPGEIDYTNSKNQRKTSHELSSDLTRSFERLKNLNLEEHPYLKNNDFVKRVKAGELDGMIQRIDFFERQRETEDRQRVADKDLHRDDILYLMFMMYYENAAKGTETYKQVIGQFGNKDQLYVTEVRRYTPVRGFKSINAIYNDVLVKAKENGEQLATIKEITDSKILQDLIAMINNNLGVKVDNANEQILELEESEIEDIATEFLLNFAINSYYLGQVAFGKIEFGKGKNFDSLFELLKRSGSTNSTGYIPDNDVYGGIGFRTDYAALEKEVQRYIAEGKSPFLIDLQKFEKKVNTHRVAIIADPKITVEINKVAGFKKGFEITDGAKIITKERAERLQISVGDINAQTSRFPKFNQVKDLITFKSKKGKYSLTKSNSIVIDELAEILPAPLFKSLKELMDNNEVDMLIFKSSAKKIEEEATINEVFTMQVDKNGKEQFTFNPNAKLQVVERLNENYSIQQDYRSETYSKPGKQPVQQQGNQLRFDITASLNDHWFSIQEKAYNELDQQLESMDDVTTRAWLLERAVRSGNDQIIVDLLMDNVDLKHPLLDEFKKNNIRSLINRKILRRQTNRLKLVEVPNINIGHPSDLKGMEIVSVPGTNGAVKKIRLPEVIAAVAGAREAQVFPTYAEAEKAARKYVDMMYEGIFRDWEIRNVYAEDGKTIIGYEVPGEPIMFHRVPADAMHSHTMARLKKNLHGTGMNFIITDPRTSVIAGSDKDGDTRLVEIIVNDKSSKGEKELPTNNKEEQKKQTYRKNVELFRKNLMIEVFGIEYFDGSNINESMFDYIHDFKFSDNIEYPNPANEEEWNAELSRLREEIFPSAEDEKKRKDPMTALYNTMVGTVTYVIPPLQYESRYEPSNNAQMNKILLQTMEIYDDPANFELLTDPIDKDAFNKTLANAPKTIEGLSFNTIDFFLAARELATVGSAVIGIMANSNTQFDIASNFKLKLKDNDGTALQVRFPLYTLKDGNVVPVQLTNKVYKEGTMNIILLESFAKDRFGYIKGVMGNVLNLALDNLTEPKIGPLGVNAQTAGMFSTMMMLASHLDNITDPVLNKKATIEYADNLFAFLNHPLVKAYVEYKTKNNRINKTKSTDNLTKFLNKTAIRMSDELSAADSKMIVDAIITLDGISYDLHKVKGFVDLTRKSPASADEFIHVIQGYEAIQANALTYVDVEGLYDKYENEYDSRLSYFKRNPQAHGRKQFDSLFELANPVIEMQRIHVWGNDPLFTKVGQRLLRVINYNKTRYINQEDGPYKPISNKQIVLSKAQVELINRQLGKFLWETGLEESYTMDQFGNKSKSTATSELLHDNLVTNFSKIQRRYHGDGKFNHFFDMIELFVYDKSIRIDSAVYKEAERTPGINSKDLKDEISQELKAKIQIKEEFRISSISQEQIELARKGFDKMEEADRILFINEILYQYGYLSEHYKSGNFSVLMGLTGHKEIGILYSKANEVWNDTQDGKHLALVQQLAEKIYDKYSDLDFSHDLNKLRDTQNPIYRKRYIGDIEEHALFREKQKRSLVPGAVKPDRTQAEFFNVIKRIAANIAGGFRIEEDSMKFAGQLNPFGVKDTYGANVHFNPLTNTLYVNNQLVDLADTSIDMAHGLLFSMYYNHLRKNGMESQWFDMLRPLLKIDRFRNQVIKNYVRDGNKWTDYTPNDPNNKEEVDRAKAQIRKQEENLMRSPAMMVTFTMMLETDIAAHLLDKSPNRKNEHLIQTSRTVLREWVKMKHEMLVAIGYFNGEKVQYNDINDSKEKAYGYSYNKYGRDDVSTGDLLMNNDYSIDPDVEDNIEESNKNSSEFVYDLLQTKKNKHARNVIKKRIVELINDERAERGLDPISEKLIRLSTLSIGDIWSILNNTTLGAHISKLMKQPQYAELLTPQNIENIARVFMRQAVQPSSNNIKKLYRHAGYLYEEGAQDVRVDRKYNDVDYILDSGNIYQDMEDQFVVSEDEYLSTIGMTMADADNAEVETWRRRALNSYYDSDMNQHAGIEINQRFMDLLTNAKTTEYIIYLHKISANPQVYSFTRALSEDEYNQQTSYRPDKQQEKVNRKNSRKRIAKILMKLDQVGMYSDIYQILNNTDIANPDYINYLLDLNRIRDYWNNIKYDQEKMSIDMNNIKLFEDIYQRVVNMNTEAGKDMRSFLDYVLGLHAAKEIIIAENSENWIGDKNQTTALGEYIEKKELSDLQASMIGGWNIGRKFLHLEDVGTETPWVRSVNRNLLVAMQRRKSYENEYLSRLNKLRSGWKEDWWNFILKEEKNKKSKTTYYSIIEMKDLNFDELATFENEDGELEVNSRGSALFADMRDQYLRTGRISDMEAIIQFYVDNGYERKENVRFLKHKAKEIAHIMEMSKFLVEMHKELMPELGNFERIGKPNKMLFPQMYLSDQEFLTKLAAKSLGTVVLRNKIKRRYRETRFDAIKVTTQKTYGEIKAELVDKLLDSKLSNDAKREILANIESYRNIAISMFNKKVDANGRRIYTNAEKIRVHGLRTDIPDVLQSNERFNVLEKHVRSLSSKKAMTNLEPYMRFVIQLYNQGIDPNAPEEMKPKSIGYLQYELYSRIYNIRLDGTYTWWDKVADRAINVTSMMQLSLALVTGVNNLIMAMFMNTIVYAPQTLMGLGRILADMVKAPFYISRVAKYYAGNKDLDIKDDFPFATLIKGIYLVHKIGVATIVEDATTLSMSKAWEIAKRLLFLPMEASEKIAQSIAFIGFMSQEQLDAYTITGNVKPGMEDKALTPELQAIYAARLRSMHGNYGEYRAQYYGNILYKGLTQFTYPWAMRKLKTIFGGYSVDVFGQQNLGVLYTIKVVLQRALSFLYADPLTDYQSKFDAVAKLEEQLLNIYNDQELSQNQMNIAVSKINEQIDKAKEDLQKSRKEVEKLIKQKKDQFKNNEHGMGMRDAMIYNTTNEDLDTGAVHWSLDSISKKNWWLTGGATLMAGAYAGLVGIVKDIEDELDDYYTFEVDSVNIKRRKLNINKIRGLGNNQEEYRRIARMISLLQELKNVQTGVEAWLNPSKWMDISVIPSFSFLLQNTYRILDRYFEYKNFDEESGIHERGVNIKPTADKPYLEVKYIRDMTRFIPGNKMYYDIRKLNRYLTDAPMYESLNAELHKLIRQKGQSFFGSLELWQRISTYEQQNELQGILGKMKADPMNTTEYVSEYKALISEIMYENKEEMMSLFFFEMLAENMNLITAAAIKAKKEQEPLQVAMEIIQAVSEEMINEFIINGELYTKEDLEPKVQEFEKQIKDIVPENVIETIQQGEDLQKKIKDEKLTMPDYDKL